MLILSILLFYAILIVVNIPAPLLGLEFESGNNPRLWYQPPGFVISIAWFVLFTLLGIARYLLVESGQGQLTGWLIALAVLCASYAYYTLGLARLTGIPGLWFGLIGNILVIVFAVIVAYRLLHALPAAGWLVVPVVVWTAYASLIVIGEMRQAGLL